MPVSDQGPLTGRYMLIPRTLIFLTRDGKVLLLKGAPHKRLWANLFNGVGGHVEQGEDFLSAARRELLEETGLKLEDLWLCGFISIDTGEKVGVGVFVLRGEVRDWARLEPFDSDEGSLEWVDIDRVYDFPLVEDLKILLPRVLSMQPGDRPFSARIYYDENQKAVVVFGR